MRGFGPRIPLSSKEDGLPDRNEKTRFALLPGNDESKRKGDENG
jgi:hypothetical protein